MIWKFLGETYTFELRGINSPAYVAVGLSDDNKMVKYLYLYKYKINKFIIYVLN